MFDGMRYVPVLLRGEVALLKEVPEDDVASSTCTERYGKRGPGASFDGGSRTSRGTRETGRRASDASAISEEESESDDEGESVYVSQDGLGPAETEAERRERLRAEFFAEIAAAAHGCTVLTTMRTEVGWISRYLFHSLITTNAPFTKDVSEWVLTLPTAAAIRDMLRASGRDTSRRASAAKPPPLVLGAPASDDDDDSDVPSGDERVGRAAAAAGPAAVEPVAARQGPARGSTSPKRDRQTPASPGKRPPTPDAKNVADRNSLFDAEETTDRLVTMLPFRHPGDQTHQFRPNVKGAPSAHQVALKLSIAPKDQLQCYPELVDDLPTPFAVPFAYDSMPDTRLHPHSVIVRKKRVRARRAFVRADWNIREEDHAEAVLMDEAQGTAAAHQRQRRTDVNQTFYDRRATNALVKRRTSSMASHGITNHRMTQKRESTLH
ncbi:zinc-binding domain-containing protein [Aureococcus anophagefferens]|nr:zinc-binding domain-containing protein [Aureococcus anophagefferens]